MKPSRLLRCTALAAALALGGCAASETMTTTDNAATVPGTESGAAAAGGINNGNGVHSGFGNPQDNTGPAGVPTYPSEPVGPYGGR